VEGGKKKEGRGSGDADEVGRGHARAGGLGIFALVGGRPVSADAVKVGVFAKGTTKRVLQSPYPKEMGLLSL